MNPRMRFFCTVTTLVLLTLSGWSAAGGTYYRWIDATGTEVNSDRPPPVGTQYEVVSTTTNRMYHDAPEEGSAESTGPADKAPEGTGAAAGIAQAEFKKDPEYCAAARNNLEALNTHAKIRVPDGNGSYRYIDEEEKAVQRTTAEAIIAQHCD